MMMVVMPDLIGRNGNRRSGLRGRLSTIPKKLRQTSINQGTFYRLAANDFGQLGSRPPHAGKWLLEVR